MMKYAVFSVLLVAAMPAFAQDKICIDASSGTRYNARPLSQHEILARNAIGPEHRAAVLGTTCIHIYRESNIGLHSLTQCIGLGDEVGVTTMGSHSELCKVTSVKPAAQSYADAKYSEK
jgi:hypothetical protein